MQTAIDIGNFVIAVASTLIFRIFYGTFIGCRSIMPASWLWKHLHFPALGALLAIILSIAAAIILITGHESIVPRVGNQTLLLTKWLLIVETTLYGISTVLRFINGPLFYGSGWASQANRMFGLRLRRGGVWLDFRYYLRASISILVVTALWLFLGLSWLVFPLLYLAIQFLYAIVRTVIPPIILLCGTSFQTSSALWRQVLRNAKFARVVTLFDGHLSPKNIDDFIFDSFRSGEPGWEDLFTALTQFSLIVIVDGRFPTPHVLHEARRAISPWVRHKSFFVADDHGACPVVSSLVESGLLSSGASVRIVPEGDLLNTIRYMTGAPGRFPQARILVTEGCRGVTVSSLPGESPPHRTGLGDVWRNPVAKGFEVSYQLSRPSRIQLDILGPGGHVQDTLIDAYQVPGSYSVISDGKNAHGERLVTGDYVARLMVGEEQYVLEFQVID